MNHCDLVLKALKERQSLTQKDVLPLGIFRLAARVRDLRDRGHEIGTQMEDGTNQYGNRVRYARYYLESA